MPRRPIPTILMFALNAFLLTLNGGSATAADPTPAKQPAAAWAKLPVENWPQIVLTNKATFDGHPALDGGSAFLIQMPEDEVLVGTAEHIIQKAGGFDPSVAIKDFDQVMTRWQVFPPTKPDLAIDAKGLARTVNGSSAHDWLLLHLAHHHATYPATPLTPRVLPVNVGEPVYLIGFSRSR